MRDDEEYIEMAGFVDETFNNTLLNPLNIRYFDPTICYCDSRIDKGIIECLLVRSAKVTIYCAQAGDTFGKDSELAATIIQGKPAIVYVPNKPELDKRANIFKEFHPLGLQLESMMVLLVELLLFDLLKIVRKYCTIFLLIILKQKLGTNSME